MARRFRVAPVAVLAVLLQGACSSSTPDEQLIRVLDMHQADFEGLRQMFLADKGLERVGADFTWPRDPATVGVTPQRLARYREYFEVLGLPDGIGSDRQPSKDAIWFFTDARGPRNSYKHYVYLMTPPDATVGDLDDPSAEQYPYPHVRGHWYLALDEP